MKKLFLAVGITMLLGGCVVSPYYDDDVIYGNPYRSSVGYYGPCCYHSDTVIIRGGNYGYGHGYNNRPYGNYRPQPPRGNWGGNNGGYHGSGNNGGYHGSGNNWGGPGNHR